MANYTTPTTRATNDLITAAIWNTDLVENIKYLREACPVGSVEIWLTNTAPNSNWLLLYGQAVSRATYATLFALISTTFGVGDGSTTFNLPDFRGRLPLGQDDMGGASANVVTNAAADSLGGTLGAEFHTLITAEMPAHTHEYQTNIAGTAGTNFAWIAGAGTASSSTGGGGAHNNMPPTLTVNFIIRVL